MSNTQYAILQKDKVPTREQWQAAIDKLSLTAKLSLDFELTRFENEGFSPCIWNVEADEEVGFEIEYGPASDYDDVLEDLSEEIAERDYCIGFSWGGDMRDCAATMIACAALAESFDAVISYEGEPPVSAEQFLTDTRNIITEALAE